MDSGDEYGDDGIPGEERGIHSITCQAISSLAMGDANKFTHNCTVHAVHAVNKDAPSTVVTVMDTTNNNVFGCHGDKDGDKEERGSVDMSLEERLQKSKSSLGDMILCPQK